MAYTDTFTYSDGNLPAASSNVWLDKDIGWVVASGQVRPRVGGSYNNTYRDGTYANNQYAQCTWAGGTANNNTSWFGPCVRMDTSTGACYSLMIFTQASYPAWWVKIGYYDGSGLSADSGASPLYSQGTVFSNSDVFRLEAVGTTLTMFFNGVSKFSWTGRSELTAGKAGLMAYAWASSGDFLADNWEGGDVGAAVSIAPLAAYYARMRATD
jgi:hypothetical protein